MDGWLAGWLAGCSAALANGGECGESEPANQGRPKVNAAAKCSMPFPSTDGRTDGRATVVAHSLHDLSSSLCHIAAKRRGGGGGDGRCNFGVVVDDDVVRQEETGKMQVLPLQGQVRAGPEVIRRLEVLQGRWGRGRGRGREAAAEEGRVGRQEVGRDDYRRYAPHFTDRVTDESFKYNPSLLVLPLHIESKKVLASFCA